MKMMQQLNNTRIEKAVLVLMLLLGLTLTMPTQGASANRAEELDKGQPKEVQQEDFLDLTKYSRPAQPAGSENQTASATIEIGGGPGVQTPELPLKITLLSLDKNSYRLGEEAFFDITLENIGKETVAIPWSPDSSIGRPVENSERHGGLAVISLMAGNTTSGGQRTAAYGLYGSETVSGSLKKLEPGQKVRIRVPFHWQFFDQAAGRELLKHSGQQVSVRAQIFLSGRRISHLPAMSANSLTVELRGQ